MERKEENKMFEKLLLEREKLQVSVDKLLQRIDNSCFGEKTKAKLREMMEVESNCNVGFSFWDCPPLIVEGKGSIVKDVDGKEYIDLLAGISVSNVGLCNPEVVEVIKEQAEKLIHYFDLPNLPRISLSQKLVKLTPGNFPKKVLYAVTGSEAIEVAIRLARWYTGKQFILNGYGEYHGITIGTMGLTGKAGIRRYYYPVLPAENGIAHFPYPYCYRCPYGQEYPGCNLQCVKFIEYMFENREYPFRNPHNSVHTVAGILFSPFIGAGGYITPPDEFAVELEKLCRKYEILLIVDEVQSGLGRSGKLWAVEHYNVTPDLIITAKSLAGGLPLSAVIGRREILDSWGPGAHLGTFAATPLACAAANKVLEILTRDGFLKEVSEKGIYFLEGLNDLKKKHPIVGDVNGKGLFIGVEFVKDRKRKIPAPEEANFIVNRCFEKGVIVERAGFHFNRFNIIPPLTISKEQIDKVLRTFDEVFEEAEKKFNIK
ncbi:aspartate aminotransferase family protein [Candidatus Aerophobetes bacterium]|nr:aspartate aminotransferase family protein [Candidatus Aerophobetes bacterium]